MAVQTFSQSARILGFKANLSKRGRAVTTDDGQALTVLVEDMPPMPDDTEPARSQNMVYVKIHALAGSLTNPRTVQSFTADDTGLVWDVIAYTETSGDLVKWTWDCSAQRQQQYEQA